MAQLRARLTYANLVATIALFVALGGSSYAAITITGKNVKNSSLTGKDVKNSSLTGADIKNNKLTGSDVLESKLGKVPSAANADNATTANSASKASDADTLGGKPGSAFAPGSTEALRAIISASDWAADGSAQQAGFWKDPWGDVHLQGAVVKGTPATAGNTIFTLPSGYRPGPGYADFTVASTVGTVNTLDIGNDGTVHFYQSSGSTTYVSLEGVVFRAHN